MGRNSILFVILAAVLLPGYTSTEIDEKREASEAVHAITRDTQEEITEIVSYEVGSYRSRYYDLTSSADENVFLYTTEFEEQYVNMLSVLYNDGFDVIDISINYIPDLVNGYSTGGDTEYIITYKKPGKQKE